jgi:hypothetical protein
VVNFRSAPSGGQALNLLTDYTFVDRILGGGALFNQGEEDLIGAFASVAGGLMVFAANAGNPALGGSKYLSGAGAGGSVNWTIPNGDYRFYLIGYETAGMEGNPACGVANGGAGLRLAGGTFTVIMIAGSCNAPPFQGTGDFGAPASASAWTVAICDNTFIPDDAADPDVTCVDVAPGYVADTSISSIDFFYPEYDHFGGGGVPSPDSPGMSFCSDGEQNPSAPNEYHYTGGTNHSIVQGSGDFAMRLPVMLRAYTTVTNCAAANRSYSFFFENGIAGAGNTGLPFEATRIDANGGTEPYELAGQYILDTSNVSRLFLQGP